MMSVYLAPMCGITDHIFRTLCYEQGCDLAYTEMISAMGWLCAPEQRATKVLMKRGKGEPKLILQLFGRDPEVVAEAACRIAQLGLYDGIDLNMGCPAKKIAPSGEGCGLMRTPETAKAMMQKTVKACGLPVSVKMRLGYDREHINVLDFARMAEDAGICSITVHGRTREQQYSGRADWDMIAKVKQSVRIPVIGNGDIFSSDDAVKYQRASGTDGVMIGRGAMGNPWIFRQLSVGLGEISPGENVTDIAGEQSGTSADRKKIRLEINRGKRETADNEEILTARSTGDDPGNCGVPGTQEVMEMILRHARLVIEYSGEAAGMRQMRKHIAWYTAGMKHSSSLRREANTLETYAQLEELLRSYEGS